MLAERPLSADKNKFSLHNWVFYYLQRTPLGWYSTNYSSKSYSSLWIYCLRQQWWSETDSETDDQQFNNTIIYKGKSLKSLLNRLRRVRIQCRFHLCRQEIVFLSPCKHTQEEEFACFPGNHRQAWKTPCRQCYASNCKKKINKKIRTVFNFGWMMY